MQLSLSVRIAEGFLSKEEATMPLVDVVSIAQTCGYDAICMRGSQLGIWSSEADVNAAAETILQADCSVSMVTGDFDIVYNNDRGPAALDRIEPYVQLARQLNSGMVRVALKQDTDIPRAQRAADIAAESGIRLVHQCHTLSLFETLDGIESTLKAIDRDNFGLIYEPANLEICGQDYGKAAIERIRPWLFNVYLQNQVIRDDGTITLPTWCRGPVSFDLQPVHAAGGVDFERVFAALRSVDYNGYVTVHQSAPDGESPVDSARRTADYLRSLLS